MRIVLNCAALLATLAWTVALVTPSADAVRLRNSFVATVGQAGDFAWPPDQVPASFLLERSPVPDEFAAVAEMLREGEDDPPIKFAMSLTIARHLVEKPQRGGALRRNSWETYEMILTKGRGYCSDFSQVFTALAIAADVPVREWGLGFDGFGAGHAFNEIWDSSTEKWIFVDSFHSLYVQDSATGVPLSVMEFQRLLNEGASEKELTVQPIVAERFAFESEAEALDYYRRGMDQFYLCWGNNVFTYDRHPVVRLLSPISRPLEQGGAIVAGVYPRIRILRTPGGQAYIDSLFRKRNMFLTSVSLLTVVLLLLASELWYWRRARRRRVGPCPCAKYQLGAAK